MDISRRRFLAGGGSLAIATMVPGAFAATLEKHAPPMADFTRWSDVKAQFRLAPDRLHFASFYFASHPKPVRDAIDTFRATLDANPFLTVEHGMFESETENLQGDVRRAAADYGGGRPDDYAITGSTTMGLALVYQGLKLKAGDDLLLTTHDHYVHHEAARMAAEHAGATVRRIPLYDRGADASVATMAARVREAIRPTTRVVGVTWVHSSTGVRVPVREIAAVVEEANRGRDAADRVLLIVDGVHGLAAVEGRPAELGCDFFCAGTHKWILAPRGTGFLYGRPEAWARLRPLFPTFSNLAAFESWMNDSAPPAMSGTVATPGGFTAYEHQWAMAAAFRFQQAIGPARAAARIRELNQQVRAGLAAMPRVTLHTPRDPEVSAGIVCFEVAGLSPDDVVKRLLERKVVASTSPYKTTYARLSASLVNDPAEVDAALRAVRAILAA